MSVPLSPSELHSLFSGLDLASGHSIRDSNRGVEFNRQWTAGDLEFDSAQPLWVVEGLEAWQAEFRRRLREVFSQTHQPAWDACSQPGASIRLHHFVAAQRTRQGFRSDSLIPGTPVWIVFDPHFVATHLDLTLGATESQASVAQLPARGPIKLGPLEMRLFQRCVFSVCHALTQTTGLLDVREYPLHSLMSEEAWIAGIPINLTSILATLEFQLSLGEYSGRLTIALTREGLQSLIPSRGPGSPEFRVRNSDLPGAPSLEPGASCSTLRVVLARATLTFKELASLQAGDVVLTSQACDAPCEVWVDGAPRFEAQAVTYQGHKAVHLTGQIVNPATHTPKPGQ